MIYIGLGHKKQQGKDTFADAMVATLNLQEPGCAVIRSFALPLKQLAMSCYGLTMAQCFGSDAEKNSLTNVYEVELVEGGTRKLLTAREVLQILGVKMREMFPGIWSGAPFRASYPAGTRFVIIPDLRFPDEYDNVLAWGGRVVKVIRARHDLGDQHISETALGQEDRTWDLIVANDGSVEDLQTLASREALKLMRGEKDPEGACRVTHAFAGATHDIVRPFGHRDLRAYPNGTGSEEQTND